MDLCRVTMWPATAVLAVFLSCGPAAAAPPDESFRDAVVQYRAGRYSDSFGRFLALANNGDADAARVVLFMHAYGPTLYGSYWDLGPDELEAFARLAASRPARKHPEFQPPWLAAPIATARMQLQQKKGLPQRRPRERAI
jgi:hypothetical protein